MNDHKQFWEEQPALLFGLCLLIGASSFLFWSFPWNWLFPVLWSLYLLLLKKRLFILLVAGSAIYSVCLYAALPSESGRDESAYFSIHSLQPHHSPFDKGLVYKGILQSEEGRIPCSIYFRGEGRPAANCDYIVWGKLHLRGPFEATFQPRKWIPMKPTLGLAEIRYKAKESLRRFLESKLKRPRTAALLGSLITGDVEERSLRYEFGRIGLQHILAVSGFHFGVLVAVCSFFLSLFLPYRWKLIFLLLAVNGYFLFAGSSPAVQRSWLTVSLYLVGKLARRSSSGLNLLGVCLGVEVVCDPLVSGNLGFQLSFLSCAGILLLYPLFDNFLKRHFPDRFLPQWRHLNLISKHGYLFSTSFRKALGLTLAVNTAILPLLLFHFHEFPILSLLYNLFFPFLVGAALFALLVSLLIHVIWPYLATFLFQAIDFFTAQLLDLVSYPPSALDYSLKASEIPALIIPLYLFALFTASVWYNSKRQLSHR